jgi:predicted AAA+ superfamily ATPase
VSKTAARGVDRADIILGCLWLGQTSSVYADALSRLSDRLHYLNASGDESQHATHALLVRRPKCCSSIRRSTI